MSYDDEYLDDDEYYDDEYDDIPGRPRWIVAIGLVAALGVSIVAGPTIVDAVSGLLDPSTAQSSTSPAASGTSTSLQPATPSTPSSAATSDTTSSVAAVPDTDPSSDTTTDVEPDDDADAEVAPGVGAPDDDAEATAVSSSTPRAPLQTIRFVPALRDVIVDVGGQSIASDPTGVVDLTGVEADGDFEFVGLRAEPALREVAVGLWSDGSNLADRNLSDVDGPSAAIGLVVSHHVTVASQQSVPDGTQLVFESAAGTINLTVGRTAWVPATRAVPRADGLASQDLTYTLVAMVVGDDTVELAPEEFEPTPEALWVVSTAADATR